MKKCLIMMALVAWAFGAQAADFWIEDFAAASKKAKDEGKYLLVNFTGSDWCGWCIRLDKEVFSTPEFKTYMDANLVGAFLDFPRRREISPERQQQNAELSEKYGIRGYPTILVLSPDGDLVGQTGYRPGGAGEYIKHLEEIIAEHQSPKAPSGQ